MRLCLFIFIINLAFIQIAAAQITADSLQMADIEVKASRIYTAERYQPVSISNIDSASIQIFSAGNISFVLDTFSPLYIRGNGPGGIALYSQRGYSPSQTQVLWNGFELNHPMLGQADLSLIPAFFVDQIQIASGSGNTSYGDRGGGTISIGTSNYMQQAGFSAGVGSFGSLTTEQFAGAAFGNWQLSFATGYEISDNDFSYSIREFSNEKGGFIQAQKKRLNNELESGTGLLNLSWQKKDHQFNSILWLHDMHNNIPGSIFSPTPQAYQDDSFVRWMGRYSNRLFNQKLTAKAYFNRQELDFINPPVNIYSYSTTTSFITDIELQSTLHPEFQLISALQFSIGKVDASEYSGSPTRSRITALINQVWNPVQPVHIYGGIRIDAFNDFGEAFSANIGANAELWKDKLFLKGQFSRNFIAPTFNDLYWPVLGNPDLQPETNIKYETGLQFILRSDIIKNDAELTVYGGRIYDGIRWLPGLEGLSRPKNLEQLELKGAEFQNVLSVSLGETKWILNTLLLHHLASVSKPRFQNDAAVNKQLRYTPQWQFKSSIQLMIYGFSSLLSFNFTDKRYTTADHSSPFDPLEEYSLMNWSGSYTFAAGNWEIKPQMLIHNVLEENYTTILGYPMPGKSYKFQITIKYKFN